MPNRKIGSMPAKITQITTKGRQKKEKTVLKTPTVLKVKISPIKTTSSTTENQKANETKVTKNDIKIMLANEVIRAQFPKKLKETVKKVRDDKTNKRPINKKQILNRKHILRSSITVLEEDKKEDCIIKQPAKRGGRRVSTKQTNTNPGPAANTRENTVISPKPVKKETVKPVKLRRRKVVIQDVETPAEAMFVSPKDKEQSPKPNTVTKQKLSVKSRPQPMTRRRKVNNAVENIKENALTKDIPEEEKEKLPIVIQKDLLNSRRSSMSELSWTKDISSSSATTCVTVSSHDFFRIDKKLPLIKLSNIDGNLKYEKMCLNGNKSVGATRLQTNDNIPCSLNLSTSSSSDTSSQGAQSPKNNIGFSKLEETLKKLSSKLKNFDLEVINWIGYTNEKKNSNVDILNDKMIQGGFLKEERDIIVTCKEINCILSNNFNVDNDINKPVADEAEDKNINFSDEQVFNKNVQSEENKKANITEIDKDFNYVMSKPNCLLEDNDDDDALSLFAESITGIDSSRRNSFIGSAKLPEVEEYVPEPVFKDSFKSPEITYQPSRITSDPITDRSNAGNHVMSSTFCEKQNADSTSIYKENENSPNYYNFYEDRIGDFSKSNTKYNNNVIQGNNASPRLMASIHKPKQGIHSYVFRGVCFFYLISSCKKTICNFPHTFIEPDEVRQKLTLISESLFIEEYMMIRTWPQLRRTYGKCFVEECIRRELSRFLIEMAIDFVIKAKENSRDDSMLKTEVFENTLLYLNKVDLNTCGDLLNYKLNVKNVLLCDLFMSTIAESQNFSQFKIVFINLTEFMYNIQRPFSIHVATHILERVSILPYDEGLAKALIKIIKNTDPSILSNSMIGKLEMQLMSSNLVLYHELMALNENTHINHSALANCYDQITEGAPSIKINNVTNNDIRYSPDTTNLDNVNKTLEPIITRTIDLKKIKPHLNTKMPKFNMEGKNKYNSWLNRTVFDNIRYNQHNQHMMTPKWSGFKRRPDRNLETRPSKYQRRDGPGYSQDFL